MYLKGQIDLHNKTPSPKWRKGVSEKKDKAQVRQVEREVLFTPFVFMAEAVVRENLCPQILRGNIAL